MGRPKGSKNKPKEVIAEKKRGRPAGSKNTPKVELPPTAEPTIAPIYGFQEAMRAFGDEGYMVYCNIPDMQLSPDDMAKAVERYHVSFGQMPKRMLLHERNNHLLPYLYAQVGDAEVALVKNTALWEINLQVPHIQKDGENNDDSKGRSL